MIQIMKETMVIYYGSPHLKGNSARLADVFAQEASRTYEIEKVYLGKKKIAPCLGCDHCKKTGTCRQQDEMIPLAEQFSKAKSICFATSVYWWGITAQLKLFIDRLYMLSPEKFEGKKLYVIAVGSDSLDGIQYKLIQQQFQEIASYCKMDFLGYLPVSADESRPVEQNEEALLQAKELGK